MIKNTSFKNKLYIFLFIYCVFIFSLIFLNYLNFNKTSTNFHYFLEKNNKIQNLNKTILTFKVNSNTILSNLNYTNTNNLKQSQKELKDLVFLTSNEIRYNISLLEDSNIKNESILKEYHYNLIHIQEKLTQFLEEFDLYINAIILKKDSYKKNIKLNVSLDNSLINLNSSFEKIYFELFQTSKNNFFKQKLTIFLTNLIFIILSIGFLYLYKTHILNRFNQITQVLNKIKFKPKTPININGLDKLTINDEIQNTIEKLVSLNNELNDSEQIIQNKNTILKNINQKLINKLEEDRNEISLIIHNNLGQYLIAINLDLISIRRSLNDPKIEKKVNSCINLIQNSLTALKETTSFISAPNILTLNFNDAIQTHCKNFQNHYECKLKLHYNIKNKYLTKEKKLVLFRCIQEGLNNIAKHSKATHIYIKLFKKNKSIYLGIRDNGIGINENYIPSVGHTSLEQRVLSLNGQFKIKNNFSSKGISLLSKI